MYPLHLYFNVAFVIKTGIKGITFFPATHFFLLTYFDNTSPQMAYFKPSYPENTRVRRLIKNRKPELIDGKFELEDNSDEEYNRCTYINLLSPYTCLRPCTFLFTQIPFFNNGFYLEEFYEFPKLNISAFSTTAKR